MPKGVYERTRKMRENISKAKMGNTNGFKLGNTYNLGKTREKNGYWKGGSKHTRGYLLFNIPENHRFFCMATNQGYILVHRLVMATYLNRPLQSEEVVHHINEDTLDNRIKNLKLFKSHGKHAAYHGKLKNMKITVIKN